MSCVDALKAPVSLSGLRGLSQHGYVVRTGGVPVAALRKELIEGWGPFLLSFREIVRAVDRVQSATQAGVIESSAKNDLIILYTLKYKSIH